MKLSALYLATLSDAYERKTPYNRKRSLRMQQNNDLSVFENTPVQWAGLHNLDGCESVGGDILGSQSKMLPSGGSDDDDHKVVGGSEASVGNWPWIAGISFGDPSSNQYYRFCGGTLVADEWVLSARHCLKSYYPEVWNQSKVMIPDTG